MAITSNQTQTKRGRLVLVTDKLFGTTLEGTSPLTSTFSMPLATYGGSVSFQNGTSMDGVKVTVRITHGLVTIGAGGVSFDVFNHEFDGASNGTNFAFPPAPLWGGVVTPTNLDGAPFCAPGPATDWTVTIVADGASVATCWVGMSFVSHVLEV